jgi:O-antigen/teichoic acid export membrane protein
VPVVFGGRYAPAVAVFQVLALAYGIQMVSWPVVTTLMALDRPNVLARLNLVAVVWTGVLYAVVVPRHGPTGAAWVYCSGHALLALPLLLAAGAALRTAREEDGLPLTPSLEVTA